MFFIIDQKKNKRPMGLDALLENHLAHWPKVSHTLAFYPTCPRGANLSLFSLYGQQFPRHWPIIKIAIFGHETWPLAKVPEVPHILSFYPRLGVEIELIVPLRAAVSEI